VQHEPQLTLFAQLINGVQLNETKHDIFWRFGKQYDYSTKSSYMTNILAALPTDFQGAIWKGWAPAKCKFFIWTMLLDSVLTAYKLLLRQWENGYF
jgi:hypothetical protein